MFFYVTLSKKPDTVPLLMVGLVTVFLGPVKISGSNARDNHYKKLVSSTGC